MARLRNRIRKADYFSDGELLRWPRDKRTTYSGLWALAEDSGCLEDDPLTWKVLLWPSPLDADISVEVLAQWRDELVADGKLIPYEAEGKRCLYISSFHKHELPRNPQQPDLPLPPWLICERPEGVSTDGKRWRRCSYRVVEDAVPTGKEVRTDSVQTPYRHRTDTVLGPRTGPDRTGPDRTGSLRALAEAEAPAGERDNDECRQEHAAIAESAKQPDVTDDDFTEWWAEYGRIGSKADAERLYRFWRDKGAERADLLTAARIYRDHCTATDCKMQHARTFLAKPPKGARARWYEWAEGEQHGSMDARGDRRLMDVMTTAAEAFGLNGGNDNGNGGRKALGGGPARAAEGRSDAGGGMAARELGAGE